MKKTLRYTAILVALLATVLACNAPAAAPTTDLELVAAQTQTAIAVSQFLTATPISAQATTPPVAAATEPPSTPGVPGSATPGQSTPAVTAPPATTAPAESAPDCTDLAKYEAETIPDGTVFGSGQQFMKTWTLRNVGTCTWTPEYALVFTKGEQMKGTSPAPIGQAVAPNATVQLFLPQTAPDQPGEHQGFWMLRSPAGRQFGLGANADVEFWVKIQVVQGATAPTPASGAAPGGAPTWTETFDGPSSAWYLGSDGTTNYQIKDGEMVMTAIEPSGDQWRVAKPSYVDNFFMQANFRTGSACSGKDGYGLIVRAPDQPDSIIDTGFVFTYSCDGSYRIYRMDNGNYNGIINWTKTPSLKPGANQENIMGILAKGNKFQLFINGTMIAEFSDGAYPGGLFGLVIGGKDTTNFQTSVKEISYWANPQ